MAKVTKAALGLSGVSERPFAAAVQRACLRLYRDPEDGRQYTYLDKIARKLVSMAADGDIAGIREVGLRLDGRTPMIQIDNSRHIHLGDAIAEVTARRKAVDQRTYLPRTYPTTYHEESHPAPAIRDVGPVVKRELVPGKLRANGKIKSE